MKGSGKASRQRLVNAAHNQYAAAGKNDGGRSLCERGESEEKAKEEQTD